MNDENCQTFHDSLASQNWHEVLSLNETNEAQSQFLSIFNLYFNLCFPLITVRKNRKLTPVEPFMTPGLLRCRHRKFELADLKKTDPLPHMRVYYSQLYRRYRNIDNQC
jgi:hypothetical protein